MSTIDNQGINLRHAILSALNLREAVTVSLLRLTGANFDRRFRRDCADFVRRLPSGAFFEPRYLEDLERILDRIEKVIQQGTRQGFVVDVHAVQGGWMDTVLTAEAAALEAAAEPVRQLLTAMRTVLTIAQAERLAEGLRP
ncbi:hypothetical protein [Pontibaca salina]|uniref:Uncharacterized protein n=1 Tax=Pontibaca salina TaxID=2795731 RepID=A0A934HWW6_9RHOB|nr:hypothetical protein [Pontibaca salina]MBI6630999.1 hypothetical protein [Pontibaca salina]